jgi:hypothetical protein
MLREGDRVHIRVSTSRVAAGAIGTIQRVFLSVPNTYDVQFDTYPVPCVVLGYVLERVAFEQGAARQEYSEGV